MIFDEANPDMNKVIHFEANGLSESLYFIKNVPSMRGRENGPLPSLREFLNFTNFEEIKYLALEGSTLSFMGLVKYNAEADQF